MNFKLASVLGIFLSFLLFTLVKTQFTQDVKNDFQNIFDDVFLNSRCQDRTRCMMSEWDYVKDLTNDMDDVYIGPTLYKEPGNWYFDRDNKDPIHFANFMCAARQDFDSVAFYSWFKNGEEIQVSSPENKHIAIAGGLLSINNPTAKDVGKYYCSASNIAGTTLGRTRSLVLAYVEEFTGGERIEVVSSTGVAVIACNRPKWFKHLEYFWKRQILAPNGTLLDDEEWIEENDRFIVDENNGNLYMIKPSPSDLNRVYRCVVQNEKEFEQQSEGYGFRYGPPVSIRRSTDLPTMNDLSFKFPSQNAEYKIRATKNITMSCIADGGYDLLAYSWTVPDPTASNTFYRFRGAKLDIIGATLSNNGEYECTVRNRDRETSIKMFLYVFAAPKITKKLQNLQARAGEQVTLTCEAMAEPAPTYRWYFNGQLIRQGSGLSPNGNALEFEIIREEHSGMYQCEAFNKYVNSFTTAQVIVDDVEPIFVSQFDFRVDGGLVFEEGYDGKILCRPFAIPVPVFSWSFESQIIQNSSKYQMWLDGTLHIKQVTGADTGDYKCLAQGGGNSKAMNFEVAVIPRVNVQMDTTPLITRVNRSVDIKCELASENSNEGKFLWFLNGVQISPSPNRSIVPIEQHYRRLDSIFGTQDFATKIQKDMKFAMSGNFPYFFASSSRENPFYPPTGPGKFSWNDAYTRRSVQSEAEWLELRKWDPFNPYKSSEQFQQELKEEADTILRYYGTFLSWYIESPLFRNRDNLHYIMVSDGVKNGTLRLFRPQQWQQGTHKCCYATLYGQTCKEVHVSVIDTPPEPLNVLFDTNSLVLSWGNPGRPNDDEVLKIEKFLILAETLPLYPIPPLMQPWPQDKTYLQPDPFWPIEAVSKAPKGFVKIAEAGPEARRMNLSNFIVGYNTMRFKVVSVNAIGPSPPSPPTEDLVIPQSRPKMVVKNIRAGHALRAATKRLLAVAFDHVRIDQFGADNCFFNVYYRETGSNSNFQMEMMRSPFQTQITIELRTNSFAVGGSPLGSRNNLQEFDVQIEIANKIGAGPKSPIVRVKEVPLAPDQAVSNVKIKPTSGSSVMITFKGIDVTREPTFVGYQVEYYKHIEEIYNVLSYKFELSKGNATRMQEVNVFDLQPAMNYKFRVRAVNAGGLGPPSKFLFGETNMAQPSEKPKDVRVYSYKGDDSIRVMWSPIKVLDRQAQLEGYRVFYWEAGLKDNKSLYKDWYRDAQNEEELIIKGLVPGQRYYVIVQPFSAGGFGIRSEAFPILMRQTWFNEMYMDGASKLQTMLSVVFPICLLNLFHFFELF